jgi:DnaJ-class molecular chaperone
MSLEAWGDENPANNDPVRDCPTCGGNGRIEWIEDGVIDFEVCTRCDGTGSIPDEYEPVEGDVI